MEFSYMVSYERTSYIWKLVFALVLLSKSTYLV